MPPHRKICVWLCAFGLALLLLFLFCSLVVASLLVLLFHSCCFLGGCAVMFSCFAVCAVCVFFRLLPFCCCFRRRSLDILLVCFPASSRKSFAEGCRFSSGIFSGALVSALLVISFCCRFWCSFCGFSAISLLLMYGAFLYFPPSAFSRGGALSKFNVAMILCLGCFSFVACASLCFMSC